MSYNLRSQSIANALVEENESVEEFDGSSSELEDNLSVQSKESLYEGSDKKQKCSALLACGLCVICTACIHICTDCGVL
ncbi:hypothetical protein ABEB36_000197 [Hypothenemus hampei]|uniref:Uncharacterized protein n=1 Tax=Hypothenemus hampei TaxID=57062 RepID=A0ABD1FCC7_HYPHA